MVLKVMYNWPASRTFEHADSSIMLVVILSFSEMLVVSKLARLEVDAVQRYYCRSPPRLVVRPFLQPPQRILPRTCRACSWVIQFDHHSWCSYSCTTNICGLFAYVSGVMGASDLPRKQAVAIHSRGKRRIFIRQA